MAPSSSVRDGIDSTVRERCEAPTVPSTPPGIQDSLLQASRVVARLIRDGLRVEEIRIQGRARPAVRVRGSRRTSHLHGSRYAWGQDDRGRYERYAALLEGVQVQWEVRHR